MIQIKANDLKAGDFCPEFGIAKFILRLNDHVRVISEIGYNIVFTNDQLVSVSREDEDTRR